MKRYFNIVNGQITPLKAGDESGLYNMDCADEQEFLNSACPSNLVFENNAIRWKTDAERERELLDSISICPKLAIRRAMRALGNEAELDAILASNEMFQKDWQDAPGVIDLNDPMVVEALAGASIDMDAIKREILNNLSSQA